MIELFKSKIEQLKKTRGFGPLAAGVMELMVLVVSVVVTYILIVGLNTTAISNNGTGIPSGAGVTAINTFSTVLGTVPNFSYVILGAAALALIYSVFGGSNTGRR